MAQNPIVTITMENGDVIKAELYPEIAPNTVNNFISLINHNFYDGVCFHRVIKGFMLQGGDPDGNGTGGPGYEIKGEFTHNGFKNDLKHTAGVLSMARTIVIVTIGFCAIVFLSFICEGGRHHTGEGVTLHGVPEGSRGTE